MVHEDTSTVPELSLEVLKILTFLAEQNGLKRCKFIKKPSPGKGDGYLGILTRIEIVGKNGKDQDSSVHVIVKAATTSLEMRKQTPVKVIYDRESFVYNTVMPKLKAFQEEKNVGNPFDSYVKCYRTSEKDFDECLVMADLKELGYVLKDCKKAMDEAHVSFVLSEYAKLHALGFAFKDQRPDSFRKLTFDWADPMRLFIENPECNEIFLIQSDKAKEALDPIKHQKEIIKFDEFVRNAIKTTTDILDGDTEAPYTSINHGDCWNNNMMFKYNASGKLEKMCFLDWQICYIRPPVLDLAYYIACCCNPKSFNRLDQHLDEYYENLSEFMQQLGSDPKVLYPKKVFLEQWKNYARYGLVMSVMLLHVSTSEKDECPDLPSLMDDGKGLYDAFLYDSKNESLYHERIREVVTFYVKNNLI